MPGRNAFHDERQRGLTGVRRLLRRLLLLLVLAPVLAGCDTILVLLALLIIGPAYPGIPQPPPVPPTCPLPAHAPSAPPALPDDLRVDDVTTSCALPEKPGLHRLNRDELARSVHDLLGVDVDAALFPPDDQGEGFDTEATAHNVSPLLIERLEDVTRDAVARALRRAGDVPEKTVLEAETLRGSYLVEDAAAAMNGGFVETLLTAPVPGTYVVRVRARGAALDGEDAKVGVVVDDARIAAAVVGDEFVFVEGRVVVAGGDDGVFQPVHRVRVEHLNPGEKDGRQRRLFVDLVELEGPFRAEARGPVTLARRLVLPCADDDDDDDAAVDDACAEDAVGLFAARAWRAPLDNTDVTRLRGFFRAQRAAGDDVEAALGTALAAVLVSPRFLFRVELDDRDAVNGEVRALTAHELATRLSYFLWSTMPDERLFELADSGALLDERVLVGEARRMLDDPRASVVVERFFAQVLGLAALDAAHPDAERFPGFDDDLRTSMRCETELFVDRLLRERRPATELLTSTTTFVNHKLAAHYGLPPPRGDGYDEVDVGALHRSGVMTQGSVLTMTSQPTRTSPTKRGKWAMDRLLCVAPDPPPPGVEGLAEAAPGDEFASTRELLESHRSDPLCASCHAVIDPLGLPLEHFDAVGRFRGSDARFAIDDSAFYFGDENDVVKGAAGLAARVAADDQFTWCLAERALSYGAGAQAPVDGCLTSDVWTRFLSGGALLSELLVEVVRSPGFRSRASTADGVPVVDDSLPELSP